jgi:hypothetical protein
MTDKHFTGVKIGDVNGSAIANTAMQADDRTNGTLLFDVDDRTVMAGETFDVTFKASEPVQGLSDDTEPERVESCRYREI